MTREIIRCLSCRCNQFATGDGRCRKCHRVFPSLIIPIPPPEGLHIGGAIRYLRFDRRMTQRELAKKMGIPSSYVSKWETGINCPDPYSFQKIASCFGMSIDSLFSLAQTTVAECLADPVCFVIAQNGLFTSQFRAALEEFQGKKRVA